jgi:hypothetical protein
LLSFPLHISALRFLNCAFCLVFHFYSNMSYKTCFSNTSGTRSIVKAYVPKDCLFLLFWTLFGGRIRSIVTANTCSDKDRYAALASQGLRGQQSPRSSQTSTLHHAARTRKYHPRVVTTGTITTGQIRPDKTHVRAHPLRDRIHDEGFDLKATQTSGAP